MRAWKDQVVCLMLASMVLQTLAATSASADHFFGRLWRLEEEKWYDGKEPADMCQDDAIQELAMNIDWLEHHIDTYGSIVAKQPDIWGEARLTKHRDEYERMMYEQLNQFTFTLNASIMQRDSSFLAQALALSAAVDGGSDPPATATAEAKANGDGQGTEIQATGGQAPTVIAKLADPDDITQCPERLKVEGGIDIEPTLLLDQMSRYLQHLHELRRINEGDDTSDSPGYALNLVRIPISMLPGKLTREGWGAEITVTATPVLSADLMPTTFRNLAINDLVDTLGLPLVRMTERHVELPTIEQWANMKRELSEKRRQMEDKLRAVETTRANASRAREAAKAARQRVESLRSNRELEGSSDESDAVPNAAPIAAAEVNAAALEADANIAEKNIAVAEADLQESERAYDQQAAIATPVLEAAAQMSEPPTPLMSTGRSRRATNPLPPSQLQDVIGYEQLRQVADFFCKNYQGANVRWAGDPRCDAVKDKDAKEFRVNLLDAQSWLGAELAAAHEMLCQPNHLMLWHALSNPSSGLARAIRSEHFKSGVPGRPSVEDLRHAFFTHLHGHGMLGAESYGDPLPCVDAMMAPERSQSHAQTVIEALAWAIVVESALLNQRLNEDIRKTAEVKHSFSIPLSDEDLSFFLPEAAGQPTSPMLDEFSAATQVFQEYVRSRWPIHVFAVDPREQDQNVADFSARRRELQFALALGFVTGQTSANSLTQFSRELETQVETISLNRTIVGFGHGTETFGWRFYPRVQALDVPGTAGTIWQSIRGTPRDHDVRKRQLEPGMRECVAIVLMPSFVPYADFDVRANWFRLTNPKNAALTMKDTMKLSRAITAMRQSQAQCAVCAHCYREGEVERLLTRVEQLDRELPLQTMRAQIPYENTLGGFEMFNTGVTDLAPELVGWYGAPGIVTTGWNAAELYKCGCFEPCQFGANGTPDSLANRVTVLENTVKVTREAPLFQAPLAICQGQGTTLFLVGDHLSVHDTKIIAGGVCIPDVRLVSRQIVRVTIPSCVNTVEVDGKPYIAVYAATPYGVTNHLHIPVHERELTTEAKNLITSTIEQKVKTTVDAEVKKAVNDLKLAPRDFVLKPSAAKLLVAATCNPAGAALPFVMQPRAGTILTVHFDVENSALIDPAEPVTANFSAAIVAKGAFQGALVELHRAELRNASGDFAISGAALTDILSRVENAVDAVDLADGNETIQLKFFVKLTCGESCGVATRMTEEMAVEITLAKSCCCDVPPQRGAGDADAPGAAAEGIPPGGEELQAPQGPEMAPTSAAPTCDCTTATSELLVR